MSRTPRSIVCLAATAALALSLSACGSDDDDTAAPPTSGGATSAPATSGSATKAPFKLGAIGTYSGPLASSIAPARPGLEAWVQSVNAAGGIDGHMIDMTIKDDAGNPTTALAAAKELVEKEKVIAIVGQASAAYTGWSEYITKQKIPVIGGLDTGEPFASDANWFPVGGNAPAGNEGIIKTIKDKGLKTVAFIGCTESPACANTKGIYEGLAKKYDLAFPVGQLLSSALPDYTAICLTLRDAKVDAVTTGFASATVIKIFEDCAKQGYKPFLVGNGPAVSTDYLASPVLDGLTAVQLVFPFTDSSTPETKAFQEALAKYGPSASKNGAASNPFSVSSWVAGKAFEAAVKAGNIGDGATSADVYKGLYAMTPGETLGGLVPPLTYKEGVVTKVPCYFIQQIEKGAFTTPNGLTPTCLT